MGYLIVGHVTDSTARIWLRGDRKSGNGKLRYRPAGTTAWTTLPAELDKHRDYAAVVEVTGLSAATDYECSVTYTKDTPTGAVTSGGFTTAPLAPRDMSFILASCNFSKLGILTSKNVDAAWTRIGQLAEAESPDFMVHCGDQIYADLPGVLDPDLPYFQREYKAAWQRKTTAKVLASLPHYMMLDDHEIFDNFANDAEYVGRPPQQIRDFALEAYKQYQHFHNPQTFPPPALYYSFEFAGAQFFALDVRSERWHRKDAQMISVLQMRLFKEWLAAHAAEPKFVICSIPFVAEVRDKEDKWCGDAYAAQREEIVEWLASQGIGKLCFLTGDMHCSYHATMTITTTGAPITVHELMSSPINQVASGMHSFIDRPARVTHNGVTYQTQPLDPAQFYGEHSNVMLVSYRRATGTVDWEIFRTKDEVLPPVPVMTGTFAL